ncbi:hypothetical protein [Streptomyces sp. NBC_00582]|uniref:hypothetical protein n=1 Tax=Streptomyces sp. NBC_00582 TaxID=2975783 RepID=UPI002E802FB1|nr:hypothetical protein [Streptomyces sp. NBC_00582]WUB64631.1 hypothetical protein OG852_31635 [Streptomyces sp. NBC_00582]
MDASRHVIVSPPSPSGGRRVRVDGEILGLAYGLADVAEFLRRAGLEGVEASDVAESGLIEWRGGGPYDWGPSGSGLPSVPPVP